MGSADMKQQYLLLIERGFNRGDYSVVPDVIAPEYEVFDPGLPRRHGPEGVIATIDEMRQAFAGFRYDVVGLVAEGTLLAARWYVTGRHIAPYRGLAPSDGQRSFRILGMSFNRFERGRIVEGHIVWDTKGFMEQLTLPGGAKL